MTIGRLIPLGRDGRADIRGGGRDRCPPDGADICPRGDRHRGGVPSVDGVQSHGAAVAQIDCHRGWTPVDDQTQVVLLGGTAS